MLTNCPYSRLNLERSVCLSYAGMTEVGVYKNIRLSYY